MEKSTIIRNNIRNIRKIIEISAKKVSRDPGEITLLAVTKTVPLPSIETAIEEGIRDLGESYIQEHLGRNPIPQARWHFIGHLQANKVRKAVLNFQVIQSVDSWDLLERIDRIAEEENRNPEVLLQVNIAGEEGKYGMMEDELFSILEKGGGLKRVRLSGLMLIPPLAEYPEQNRPHFRRMRELWDRINATGYYSWKGKYLSMGMSRDFAVAVEEGASLVRIGTGIFGERGL